MRRPALALAAACWLLAACGGRSPGAIPSPRTASTGPPAAAPTNPGPTGSPSVDRPGATPAPRSGGTPTARVTPSPPPTGVSATLDKPCVRRGDPSDRQGLTVRTAPGYPVGYVTTYSDGSSVIDHPEYQSGGQGGGLADETGLFRHTWVVPGAAPLGTATVSVNAGQVFALPFTVVAAKGRCP